MPLVRITVASGLSRQTRRALGDAAHKVLVEVAKAPAEDQFQIVEEVPAENLIFSPSYLGLSHRAPIAVVQVFMNVGRTVEVKRALYAGLAEALGAAGGFRKEDVIVNLVEVPRENWSFGGGAMSYPPQP